jgi:Fic family protein
MFQPKYTITSQLLANIKRIAETVTSLNERRFPKIVLLELEREARDISSFASTSIEGNPLPLTDVKRLLQHAPTRLRDTEREVLNYNNAIKELKRLADGGQASLDSSLILKIHGLVTDGLVAKTSCGKWRREPVFVNDPRLRETVYWPPDHQEVVVRMSELTQYVRKQRDEVDPLILAGIFHKQFVLVHPFIDGNGRTVRLATKVLLAGLGLDTFNLFSFERYYNANVTKYFATVGERGNYYDLHVDFTLWLEYFTDGILDELLRVKKELERTSNSEVVGLKEHHRAILQYLDEHGTITDAVYAGLVKRARPTRALDFHHLLDQGLIERHAKGRATYYTRRK